MSDGLQVKFQLFKRVVSQYFYYPTYHCANNSINLSAQSRNQNIIYYVALDTSPGNGQVVVQEIVNDVFGAMFETYQGILVR